MEENSIISLLAHINENKKSPEYYYECERILNKINFDKTLILNNLISYDYSILKLYYDDTILTDLLKKNGKLIKYINNPNSELQITAVSQNGHALKYISNQKYEIVEKAIINSPAAINYILYDQFEEDEIYKLFNIAINKNALVFYDICKKYKKYISENLFEQLSLVAVKNIGRLINLIDKPKYEHYLLAIKTYPDLIFDNPNIFQEYPILNHLLVWYNPILLKYIKKECQTIDMCLVAAKKDKYAFQYIQKLNYSVLQSYIFL